jgi:hypothetical protein
MNLLSEYPLQSELSGAIAPCSSDTYLTMVLDGVSGNASTLGPSFLRKLTGRLSGPHNWHVDKDKHSGH